MNYRIWFYAATAYNAIFGVVVVLGASYLGPLAGFHSADSIPLVQVTGMIVGVYAYAYYLLARDPKRYCGMIWVGLAGKTFGPVGFLFSAVTGRLPWSFGWVCLFNDVIWWPAFWSFALKYARKPLGEDWKLKGSQD